MVLRHEFNHLKRKHPWMKVIITCGLVLHWWNPLIWLAYKYTCLDLEMDCDRFTLEQLSPQNCREYAKTLVELGAGKQIWDAPLAFGESDGAARVKAAVTWKKQTIYVQETWKQKNFWLRLPSFLVFLLLLLFFVGRSLQCGPPGGPGSPDHGAVRRQGGLCPAGPAAPAGGGPASPGCDRPTGVAADRLEFLLPHGLPVVRRPLGGVQLVRLPGRPPGSPWAGTGSPARRTSPDIRRITRNRAGTIARHSKKSLRGNFPSEAYIFLFSGRLPQSSTARR